MNSGNDSGSWLLGSSGGSGPPPAPPGAAGDRPPGPDWPEVPNYELLRLVGVGGMGLVYEGRDRRAGTRVAIKMLRPELAESPEATHRFFREARHMRKLAHPQVLPVLEVGESRRHGPFLATPFLDQGSLAKLLKPQRPLPVEVIRRIVRQVAEALDHAHRQGVIHGDVKPANVLLDGNGDALLADFGLARATFNDSIIDVPGTALAGTVPYLSPAVVAGEIEDTRRDIYALGAVLYEMLTGKPPYSGGADEIRRLILSEPPRAIRELNPEADPALTAVAGRAMARQQRNRYASMGDLLDDLRSIEAGQHPQGLTQGARQTDPRSGPARPGLLPGRLDTLPRPLTPALSHLPAPRLRQAGPMGEGARGVGEGNGVVRPSDSSVSVWLAQGLRRWGWVGGGLVLLVVVVLAMTQRRALRIEPRPPAITVPFGELTRVELRAFRGESPVAQPRWAVGLNATNALFRAAVLTDGPGEPPYLHLLAGARMGQGEVVVRARDGWARAKSRIPVTVVTNTPPTMRRVPPQTVLVGDRVVLPLEIADAETGSEDVVVNAEQADRAVLRRVDILTAGERHWVLLESGDAPGHTEVKVTMRDGSGHPSSTFPVEAVASNRLPTLAAVTNQTVLRGDALDLVFRLNGGEPPFDRLKVIAAARVRDVITNLQVQLEGSFVHLSAAGGAKGGTTEILVTLTDGEASRGTSFRVEVCEPVVTEHVALDETGMAYFAADQVTLEPQGDGLAASLRFQTYNVGNPSKQIDQLLLAADWQVLALIYQGIPGGCPGVLSNWSQTNIALDRVPPGRHTLYFAGEMAKTQEVAIAAYESQRTWRVAIGLIERATNGAVTVQPLTPPSANVVRPP